MQCTAFTRQQQARPGHCWTQGNTEVSIEVFNVPCLLSMIFLPPLSDINLFHRLFKFIGMVFMIKISFQVNELIACPHRTLCDGTSFYCYFGADC